MYVPICNHCSDNKITTANKIVDKYMYISIENVKFLPQND